MKNIEFEFDEEFQEYLNQLNKKDLAKFLAMMKKIEENGLEVALKLEWVKHLDNGLYEIRERSRENFMRGIFFRKSGDTFFITNGFNKKQNSTPRREMNKALNRKRKMEG